MTAETCNPDDVLLTQKLIAESEAARSASRSVSTRNILLGSAAVVCAAGIGLAAMIWSWNQRLDPEALKRALSDMAPIKVEASLDPNAKVKVEDGGKVVLADGGKVGIDPKAEVAIKSGGKVGVEGNVGIIPGSKLEVDGKLTAQDDRVSLPDTKAQPATIGDKAIKREVTVFNFVQLDGNRSVVTGWNFPSGSAGSSPTQQFCYLSLDSSSRGRSQRIDIAYDGKPFTDNRDAAPGFDGLVAKCIWWKGAE
jgi:hypothetical protein